MTLRSLRRSVRFFVLFCLFVRVRIWERRWGGPPRREGAVPEPALVAGWLAGRVQIHTGCSLAAPVVLLGMVTDPSLAGACGYANYGEARSCTPFFSVDHC